MTKKFTHKLFSLAIAASAFVYSTKVEAQSNVPDALNFQAIARDITDNIIQNAAIEVQMTVHNNSSNGPILSQLRFIRTTDDFGQFSLTMSIDSATGIGTGQTIPFNQINWAVGDKYIQIEYKPNLSSGYIDLGAVRANSTFYAFHSRTAEKLTTTGTSGQVLKHNGTDWVAGTDNDNQTLSQSGNTVTLSNSGGTINVDPSTSNELQTLSQTGNTVTLSNSGGSVNVDPSTTNEIQNLTISGNTLSLSGSTPPSVTLPTYTAGNGIDIDGSNFISAKSSNDYAVYEQRLPSGTNVGTASGSGVWNQRNLNSTQVQIGTSITRNNSIITLLAGVYYIRAYANGYNVDGHNLCLKDIANNIVLSGTTMVSNGSGFNNSSFIEGYITVSSSTSYKLDHWIGVQNLVNGLSISNGITNVDEVSCRIIIQKIQ